MIKRMALGLAVAAFAAPVAQAKVDEGTSLGSKTSVNATDNGMPRAMPNGYGLPSGDQIEVVRAQARGTSSDRIEFVRLQPRSTATEVVGRYLPGQPGRYLPGQPSSPISGSEQVTASNISWDDAAIGAGLALALLLLGGGAALATRHMGREQTA